MKEITVQELQKMREDNTDHQLIDVRESHEYETANISGELIPLGSVLTSLEKISKDKPVIIHCRSGARSGAIITELEKNHGYTNLLNLKGGIMAWATEIDSSLSL